VKGKKFLFFTGDKFEALGKIHSFFSSKDIFETRYNTLEIKISCCSLSLHSIKNQKLIVDLSPIFLS